MTGFEGQESFNEFLSRLADGHDATKEAEHLQRLREATVQVAVQKNTAEAVISDAEQAARILIERGVEGTVIIRLGDENNPDGLKGWTVFEESDIIRGRSAKYETDADRKPHEPLIVREPAIPDRFEIRGVYLGQDGKLYVSEVSSNVYLDSPHRTDEKIRGLLSNMHELASEQICPSYRVNAAEILESNQIPMETIIPDQTNEALAGIKDPAQFEKWRQGLANLVLGTSRQG